MYGVTVSYKLYVNTGPKGLHHCTSVSYIKKDACGVLSLPAAPW